MSKPGNKFNKTQRADAINKVGRLYLQGVYQTDIARQLDISQSQVSQYLKKLRSMWQEEAKKSYDEIASKEIAKLDNLEKEAWIAFFDKGSQKFMETILNCIAQRNKITGLGVVKIAPTDPTGTKEYDTTTNPAIIEERIALVARLIEAAYPERIREQSTSD